MTHSKSISAGVLSILVLLALVGSACASKQCPTNGNWTSGDKSGLTGFAVNQCGISSVYYTIAVSGVQSSGTISLMDTCQMDDNRQFSCIDQGYANARYKFTGKFTANNAAEGQLVLSPGFRADAGVLTQDMTFSWKATPTQ